MKQLTNAIKFIIAGAIAIISGIITFIFEEKHSLNNHEKLIDKQKERQKQEVKQEIKIADLSDYVSKYANEFHAPKSERKIEKLLKNTVAEQIPCYLDDAYDFLNETISRNGRLLEKKLFDKSIICIMNFAAQNKRPVLAKLEVKNESIIINGVCATGSKREVQKFIKYLEKTCKKAERKRK